MRTKTIFLLAACTGCAVPIRASVSPAELMAAVETAEVSRDGHAPGIAHASGVQQNELRLAAMKALARIEEVGTSSLAVRLLGDRDQAVATWAAFALGQLAEPEGIAALLTSLQGVSPVPDQVLLALGRSGTATTAATIERSLSSPESKIRAAAALSLGLIAKRLGADFPRERYARQLAPMVRDPKKNVRYGAVYGLMRMPGRTAAVALISALGDSDPEIRANAARGLGEAGAAPQVLDAVISDPDWRVRAEVVKALAKNKEDAPAAGVRLVALIDREFARFKRGGLASGRSMHVLLEIVNAADVLGAPGQRVVEALERAPWNAEGLPPDTAPDLARLSCAVSFLLDKREGVVRRVRKCGEPSVPEWRRLEYVARLLAADGSDQSVEQLVNMTGHQDPKVRAAAVTSLGEVKQPSAAAALVQLFDSNDFYVLSAAAETMARPEFAKLRPEGLVAKLGDVMEALVAQPDASLIVGVLDAAGALGKDGAPLLPRLEALAKDQRSAVRRRAAQARHAITGEDRGLYGATAGALPYTLPPSLRARVPIVIHTVRGDIELELFGDIAPHAVGLIVDRASRGFYRNGTFHRVVSDFVIQGGCPRGDGWGGPGFTIPEETSPLPYVRGAAGIATNGRDTGGSQFFIMHARHPHLEGGYSLIGRVMSGIDVADAIQQDDQIIDVEVKGAVR